MRLTDDQALIDAQTRQPRILALWRALQATQRVTRFMNSGAHPDDETSGMLAALGWRDGWELSCLCSTRGEGGQNDIGGESGGALGALRTAEMERAADVLGLDLYWLGEGPDDPITDFGFSKSGEETLGKWGRDRTLARFTHMVRLARPDVICPTFLDVPGQHGHHRAMTALAHEVMETAADPSFAGSDAAPWRVSKLYLPAWSGAGQAYDDDLPPPPATLTVPAKGADPVTGWTYAQIGQQSRAYHRTQAMGRWEGPGSGRDYPLHLARGPEGLSDTALDAGLPVRLGDLDCRAGAELDKADRHAAAARAAFPDLARIRPEAAAALAALRRAMAALSAAEDAEIGHRLRRMERRLAEVLALASGAEAVARPADTCLRPGGACALDVALEQGAADRAEWRPDLPEGWSFGDGALRLAPDAPPSPAYPTRYDPLDPPAPRLLLSLTVEGQEITLPRPLTRTPLALPATSAAPRPAALLWNRRAPAPLAASITAGHPQGAEAALDLPANWQSAPEGDRIALHLPQEAAPGRYEIGIRLDGRPASLAQVIDHPHAAPRLLSAPALLTIGVIDAAMPEGRVAYIGGGQDRVGDLLSRAGARVEALEDSHLAGSAPFDGYAAVLVGIFAMRFRPALRAALPALHGWVEAGGTLTTLYHRPWDAWDPETVPPRRLEIGQPSLRWRVTDEGAEVTHLAPDHPVLTGPNPIGPEDWQGWHKERGLYFAKSWDAAYLPLVELADPGEAPHRGALLSAEIGAGRHNHCALNLHHQMARLVPGAYRLMANLLAPRG